MTWLVVLALFVQALMPMSQALARGSGPDVEYLSICTPDGVQQIPIGRSGVPTEPADRESCPLCVLPAAPLLLGVQDTQVPVGVTVPEDSRFAAPVPTIRAGVWRGAPRPSRGPPLFS